MAGKHKKGFQKDVGILQTYLHNGIDLEKRRISFGDVEYSTSDFEFASVTIAIRAIDKMLDLNNQAIEIHMNSYGGDPYQMLALKDKILESSCKFVFYGRGVIMSAATWIMVVCDERYLSEDAVVMVHNGWVEQCERLTDIQINMKEQKRLQELLEQIYTDNSFMDKKFWHAVCKRDLFLTSDEVIALGLADALIVPKKRGNLRSGLRSNTFNNPTSRKELRKLVEKLFERVELQVPSNIVVEIKREEFEEIKPYDRTQEELEKLGLKDSEDKKEEG